MNNSSSSQIALHTRLLVWSLVAGAASGSLSLVTVDVGKGDRVWDLAWGLALFTGLPFAAFWALALMGCDPAWTFERWRRVTQPASPEGG